MAPRVDPTVFVAPGASIVGNVTIGKKSSVFFGCTLRGDLAPVIIGEGCNIQDGAVLHVDHEKPAILENLVSVGHSAVVHACHIKKGALVGIGSVVLNGAVVGEEAWVGAGALVPPGMSIPPRSLAVGVPAKVVRTLTPEEIESNYERARTYMGLAESYKEYGQDFPAAQRH
ncbi:MAG: gamma carbonic anhydrase family protein [Armatimonadetes bacterium]|nr:gamma carbonic anhydrase family protein [Armatimonadota bacterium]